MRGHEVDGLRRHHFRGHREVAFVLAALVVHDHDHAAGPELGQGGLDGGEGRAGRRGDQLSQGQRVAHPILLGAQVGQRMGRGLDLAGKLRDDLDTGGGQGAGLARVVREQADPADEELAEDRRGQREIPAVRGEAQRMVGVHGVEAAVLQGVRAQLGHQADAAALLMLVDEHSAPFGGDRAHGQVELAAAVAAQGAEDLPRETLRMDAHERRARGRIAEN